MTEQYNKSNELAWLDEITFNEAGLIPAIAQDKDTGRILMMAWMNAESLSLTAAKKVAVYYSRSRQKLWHKGETSGHIQKVASIRLDCDADVIVLQVTQIGDIACHTGRQSCFYKELTLTDNEYNWQTVEPVLKDPNEIYDTNNHSVMASKIVDSTNAASEKPSEKDSNVAQSTVEACNQQLLTALDKILQQRKIAPADSSYVASLYAKGLNKILEKIGEEATETIISAKDYQQYLDNPASTTSEVSKNKGFSNHADYLKYDLVYEIADIWFHTLVTLAWFDMDSQAVLSELARRFGMSGIEEKSRRNQ